MAHSAPLCVRPWFGKSNGFTADFLKLFHWEVKLFLLEYLAWRRWWKDSLRHPSTDLDCPTVDMMFCTLWHLMCLPILDTLRDPAKKRNMQIYNLRLKESVLKHINFFMQNRRAKSFVENGKITISEE